MMSFRVTSSQQVVTYNYPVGSGEALLSTKYKVYMKVGAEEKELQVLQSNAIWEGDWMGSELNGRTFSFAQISRDKSTDSIEFRIVKLFGNDVSYFSLSPRSYKLKGQLVNGKEIVIKVGGSSKYISINFSGSDNKTTSRGWIKHMLEIFIDPLETNVPQKGAYGVVEYSESVNATTIRNAKVIYFSPGYYNLRDYKNGGIIDSDGQIKLVSGQSIYLAGGAFVEGIVARNNSGDSGQGIRGRGIISGRQYMWRNHPQFTGVKYGQIVELGKNSFIDGVMLMESPHHGIVAPNNCKISNMKFLGWHSNNDGVRVGAGSEISNSFIRAVDDHFYNFDIYVHDCVLWAGHNGSIMTYGWGGEADSKTYNSGSSKMEDIDIINCEWIGLGNNNGLIMSQTGLDYKPYGYGGSSQTVLRNIRIEGSIPGITNIKPRSGGNGNVNAVQVSDGSVGYLGDILLENISVENQLSKGRIRGKINASPNGTIYFAKNIELKNVTIGGKLVTEKNKATFFEIESTTTKDIRFTTESETPNTTITKKMRIEAENFDSSLGIETEPTSDEGGGQNVGYINTNDFCTYNLSINPEGKVKIRFRVATGGTGGYIYIEDGNGNIYDKVLVDPANSGGWQNWYTTSDLEIVIPKGETVLKLRFNGGGGFLLNINWLELEYEEVPNSIQNLFENIVMVYPNPSRGKFSVSVNDISPENISLFDITGKIMPIKISKNFNAISAETSFNIVSGTYILQIESENVAYTTKLLILE